MPLLAFYASLPSPRQEATRPIHYFSRFGSTVMNHGIIVKIINVTNNA